jgi:uncharacterized protein YlxP (DUF503 family)
VVVGVLELALAVPAHSLKEKRGVVRRILHRTRNTFKVAVAEVDELDNPGAAVVGIVTVSNDKRHVQSMLSKIEDFVEDLGLAEVVDVGQEITHY